MGHTRQRNESVTLEHGNREKTDSQAHSNDRRLLFSIESSNYYMRVRSLSQYETTTEG
jgi:hypothetical protein